MEKGKGKRWVTSLTRIERKGPGRMRLLSRSAPGLRVQCRFRAKRSEFEGDRSRETRAGVVQNPDGGSLCLPPDPAPGGGRGGVDEPRFILPRRDFAIRRMRGQARAAPGWLRNERKRRSLWGSHPPDIVLQTTRFTSSVRDRKELDWPTGVAPAPSRPQREVLTVTPRPMSEKKGSPGR